MGTEKCHSSEKNPQFGINFRFFRYTVYITMAVWGYHPFEIELLVNFKFFTALNCIAHYYISLLFKQIINYVVMCLSGEAVNDNSQLNSVGHVSVYVFYPI